MIITYIVYKTRNTFIIDSGDEENNIYIYDGTTTQ